MPTMAMLRTVAAVAAAGMATMDSAAPAFAVAAQTGEPPAPAVAFSGARTAAADVLQELRHEGGGADCSHDVQCGWYNPRALATDRRTLPSGNAARCLVGRCVCSNRFEERWGCPRCTILERSEYSYSNQDFEKTTKIRDDIGRHIDLCALPVGGAPCEVGICKRDSRNRTLSCDGDVHCDAGGSGSGMCVGAERHVGTCVCARNFFCKDCSLHELDVRDGARCGKYITGGALCRGHDDCSLTSSCVTKDNRSFCHCDRGYTCRRCEHHLSKLELGQAKCPCDAPKLVPFGGEFNKRTFKVGLTGPPWDAEDECEIRYRVEQLVQAPWRPPWTTPAEALAFLTENGTKLRLGEEHVELSVKPNEDGIYVGHVYDEEGKKLTTSEHFYIVAVTVPRKRSGWLTSPSRVVHSGIFTLSAAHRVHVIGAVLIVAIIAIATCE